MKRVFLLLMTLGMLALTATAIPADPTPVKVTQPDGSTVTVRLHGDEFFHLTQTLDGYTLVKDASGYYTYARQDQGGRLVSSGIAAHDVSHRSGKEMAALAGIPKGLNDKPAASSGARRLSSRNQAMRRVGADGLFDYDSFRGLIILINYTDKKFSMSEAGNFYSDMVNTHDYTGYTMNGRRVNMTGSVRDYFYDNSNHIFDPHFDVVGPVNVNFKCTDPKSSNNAEATVVLNVGVAADFNAVYVAPHRAVRPYAGELFHFYHADYIRAFEYVSLRINIRADSFKFS